MPDTLLSEDSHGRHTSDRFRTQGPYEREFERRDREDALIRKLESKPRPSVKERPRENRSHTQDQPKIERSYVASLDGLRAFGVIAVIAYHLNLWFAQGGLIGVAVFFVLSGYLTPEF